MGTFNDGDSGSSIRTKINTAIQKTEGSSAISTIDVDGGAIDGVTLGTNSAVTEAQVDNININGNTISSTNTNGNVVIDPNGTGDVQLGGDLDANSNSIKLGDRSSSGVNELIFGDGDDLKIFHGTNNHSQIVEGGSGNLQIYASNLQLKSNAGADYIVATDGGAVELYHNSNKKAETTSSGLQTTGTVNVNGAYTLPTSDGSANQVLQTNGSGTLSFATVSGGGGDPDLYRDNASSATTPSATGANAVAIGTGATASGAGGSVAIGQDATSSGHAGMALGDNATASNTRGVAFHYSTASGVNGFAAVGTHSSSTYGAKGTASVSLGALGIASGNNSFVLGETNSASGTNAHSYGSYGNIASGNYSLVLGTENSEATGVLSVAIGSRAKSVEKGKIAYSSGRFAANGDSQGALFILRADTTDATATVLTTDNAAAASTNQIVAASDTCITFHGTLVAMQNGAQAYGSWEIRGLLVNDGGTTTLANSSTTVIQNASSWGMALSADNTNNALAITCTGEASHNIRWVANISTSEVTYA